MLSMALSCQTTIQADNATYYVAINGRDTNPGTEAAPWRTVQHAADTVGPGDTVLVRGGVYEEAVTINVSGSAGSVITFQSYPGETAVLDGTNLTVPAADNGLFLIDSQSYVTISGFELRHYRTTNANRVPVGIYVTGSAHHIQLRHNHIHHIETNAGPDGNAHGIAVYGSQAPASIHDVLIDGNELHDLKLGNSESLVLNGNVEQFTVSHNLVHDNDNIGIDLIGYEGVAPDPAYDRARDGVIRQNTVYNIDSGSNPAYFGEQSADGIYVDGGTRLVIEGNRVYQCNIGVEIASEHGGRDTSYVTVRNNLIYHNHIVGIAMGGYDRQCGSSHHNAILNNTLYQNDANHDGSGEIMLQFDTADNVIKNNLIVANDQSLFISNPYTENSRNVVDYNLYFSPLGPDDSEWQWKNVAYQGFAAYRNATGNDAHSLFVNPQFVDEATLDFHLQAGSTAVDAGDNTTDSGDVDFDGNPRSQNGAIDMGALEYTAVTLNNFVYLAMIVTE